MNIIKKFFAFLVCINIFLCSAAIYYTFAEDTEGGSSASGINGITERFDYSSGMYIESMDKDIEFISSAPNGCSVCDGVYFDMPSNIDVAVEKDGVYIQFLNKTPICNAGYYIMKVTAENSFGELRTGIFTFRITAPPSNKINTNEYKCPKVSCIAAISADSALGMNRYSFPNNKAFFTDIGEYGQTVESAKFWIPRNVGYSLKRNGSLISLVNNHTYTETGNYTLKVFAYSYGQSGGYEVCYETVLSFKISKPIEKNAVDNTPVIQAVKQAAVPDISSEAEIVNEDTVDSLLESYFESAGIYSEAFSSGNAFYTNTPNDGIVGGNVYFDVPYNMSVSMTKDGNPVEFKNKAYLNDEGSYSMVVTDVYDDTTARARFSFRIQKGIESSANITDDNKGEDNKMSGEENENVEVNNNNDNKDENDDDKFEYDIKNKYDKEKGMFVFNCGKEEFYCSVPDGMFSNQSVVIDVTGSIEAALYRNKEEIELTDSIEDDGKYNLKVKSGEDETEIVFYVSSYSTNSIESFIVPEGYSFIAAEYSDVKGVYDNVGDENSDLYKEGMLKIEKEKLSLPKVFELPLDGQYDFILEGKRGMPTLSSTIILDRIAPVIEFDGLEKNMKTSKKSVDIYCGDPEAEIILTDADGNTEKLLLTDGKAIINGDGKFKITAGDMAGNESEYTFTLGKSGGSALKFIVIAVIILAVFFAVMILLKFTVFSKSEGIHFNFKENIVKTKLKKERVKKNNISDSYKTDNYEIYNRKNIGKVSEDWETEDDWENIDESAADIESYDDDWENS